MCYVSNEFFLYKYTFLFLKNFNIYERTYKIFSLLNPIIDVKVKGPFIIINKIIFKLRFLKNKLTKKYVIK